LNVIWKVQPRPGMPLLTWVRSRFLSFTMVLGIGFLLLVSMIVSAALAALTGAIGDMLPVPPFVLHGINFLVSFLVISLLFAMIFKVLPDAKVRWRDVWIGAVFTALLFSVGKHLLGLYLGRAAVTSAYGAAGSLVLVLLWIYYSSLILFFGAEFTQTYARARVGKIVPSPHAVPINAEARAQQGLGRKQAAGPIGTTQQEPQSIPALAPLPVSAIRKSPRRVLEEVLAVRNWKTIPKTAEIVRRKPWPYLGLALGFGVATGWMVKKDLAHRRNGHWFGSQ
jgi:membrane protein